MGLSWNRPDYCPRRPSSEETRGSGPVKLPVKPSEVIAQAPFTPQYGENGTRSTFCSSSTPRSDHPSEHAPSLYCGEDTRSIYTPLSIPSGHHPYEYTPSLDYGDDTRSIFSSSSIRGSYQDTPSLDYKDNTRSTFSSSSIGGSHQDTPSLDCIYNTRSTFSSSIGGSYQDTPSLDCMYNTRSTFFSSSIGGSYQETPSLDDKDDTQRRGSVPVRPSKANVLVPYTVQYDDDNTRSTFSSSSIQGSYHASDADVELDDRGYSTSATKTLQPHTSIQNLPIVPAHPIHSAYRSDNAKDSFATETENDDGYQDASAHAMPAQKYLGFEISSTRSTQQRSPQPPGPPIVSCSTSSAGDPNIMPIPPPSVSEFHRASVRPQHATEGHKSTFRADHGSGDAGYVQPATAKSPKQTLFPCLLDECNYVATSPDSLSRHQETIRHPTPEYECFGCYCAYSRKCDLLRHHKSKKKCKEAHEAVLATC